MMSIQEGMGSRAHLLVLAGDTGSSYIREGDRALSGIQRAFSNGWVLGSGWTRGWYFPLVTAIARSGTLNT